MNQLTFASDGVVEVLLALTTFRNLFTDLRGNSGNWAVPPGCLLQQPLPNGYPLAKALGFGGQLLAGFRIDVLCSSLIHNLLISHLAKWVTTIWKVAVHKKLEVVVRMETMIDQLSDLNLFEKSVEAFVYTSPKPSNWGLKGLLASWNHPRLAPRKKTKALLISLALLGIHLTPPASNVPDIWAKRGGWCSKYTPENQHGTWKYTLRKGETSTTNFGVPC